MSFEAAPAVPSGRTVTPERTVLWLGLLFGLLFLAATPPFQAPDEYQHVYRSYHLSEGHLRTAPAGGVDEIPASLPAAGEGFLRKLPFQPEATIAPGEVVAALAHPLAPEERRAVWILGTYTPLAYLPQAAGAAVSRALGLPALGVLYLARLANLLACLALAVAAVRIAPFFRWTLALLALTPMALFLRSSASPDALTNALSALLLAAVLALAAGPEEGRRRARRLLFAAALGVALCKGGGYALLAGLVLLVPWQRLGATRRRAATAAAGLLALTAAGFAVSAWIARDAYFPMRPEPRPDPEAQVRVVLADPVRFAGLVAGDYARRAPHYLFQFVGNLGWLDTPLPIAAAAAWALLLLGLAMSDGPGDGPAGAPLDLRQRLVLGAVLAGTLAALSTSQYLTWTPVGSDTVEGLQGRYFIPAAPLALLLFTRRRAAALGGPEGAGVSPGAGPRTAWGLAAAAALMLTIALTTTVLRYYVD